MVGAEETLQRRGKIDIGRRFFLNGLQNRALSPRDDRVQLMVDLAHLGMKTALRGRLIRTEREGIDIERTSSSSITKSRTRARSTESPCPVTTSSHTRSVSSPDQPAVLLMPSGVGRFERDSGLLTTAMCARVWDAISSRRRRTSDLRAGFVEGESRISERATLIAARC